jgi:NhaA family Na+:H+ antiporter
MQQRIISFENRGGRNVASAPRINTLDEPVTGRMRQDYAALRPEQTVSEALAWLRQHPPGGRVIYFYVVDHDGVLQGVVPTRRLILTAPSERIAAIMVSRLTAVPATATVLEACEFFILHRLLAFPVVDEAGRLVGIVDIDLYTDELAGRAEIAPVARWLKPFVQFLHIQSASGIVLMIATAIALLLANSPWAAEFTKFWEKVHFTVGFGDFALDKSLAHWINDGLMTLFFFVVGLEIKREIVAGELSDWHKALLPIVAALGGMVAPACTYIALHWGKPTLAGWGIPMATDIAFVVGFLALLGSRVPHSVKVLLLSLAIADDIGATLVIALVYTKGLSLAALAVGAAGFGVVILFRWIGVRAVPAYVVVGAIIWVAFVKSGVHPTVAGVALGLLTPARPWMGDRVPFDVVADLFRRIGGYSGDGAVQGSREPMSPLDRLEQMLHPWVAFVIMPVFALANAGVSIEVSALSQPVALAVMAGLVLGKPIGIVLFCWAAVKLGVARMPAEINAKILLGAGCLAGIGFTMSLFIASLAMAGAELGVHLDEAKIGILVGSGISAALGFGLLWRFLPKASASGSQD